MHAIAFLFGFIHIQYEILCNFYIMLKKQQHCFRFQGFNSAVIQKVETAAWYFDSSYI